MNIIKITTQAEFDALPSSFSEFTQIQLVNTSTRITVSTKRENSSVEARENSSVEARENSSVVAWENSSVVAWGNSSVVARENSSVVARENSSVVARENSSVEAWENSSVVAWGNSSVEAWENSSVEARENSSVEAWGNSSVESWGNSSVEARENSSVVAWGNSSVEARENSSVESRENSSVVAWGNSSVEARENSSVVAWGNSSVEARENSSVESRENSSVESRENSSVEAWENSSVVAWGNSSVVAWGNSGIHNQSELTSLILAGYSVVWMIKKAKKCIKKFKTVTVITPIPITTNEDWLDNQGVEIKNGNVVLFKRVSSDFKTQEDTKNETKWTIGTELVHPNYNPTTKECGEGKFHACSHPYFCDEFRNLKGDKYIAIEIKVEDLYCWPSASYPHKIAFRAGTVLYQCDKRGNKS